MNRKLRDTRGPVKKKPIKTGFKAKVGKYGLLYSKDGGPLYAVDQDKYDEILNLKEKIIKELRFLSTRIVLPISVIDIENMLNGGIVKQLAVKPMIREFVEDNEEEKDAIRQSLDNLMAYSGLLVQKIVSPTMKANVKVIYDIILNIRSRLDI